MTIESSDLLPVASKCARFVGSNALYSQPPATNNVEKKKRERPTVKIQFFTTKESALISASPKKEERPQAPKASEFLNTLFSGVWGSKGI
jgi:hypothetical protein